MQRTRRAAEEGSIHSRRPSGRPRKDNEEIENLAVMRPGILNVPLAMTRLWPRWPAEPAQRVALSLDPFLFAIYFVRSLACSQNSTEISTRVHCVSLIVFRWSKWQVAERLLGMIHFVKSQKLISLSVYGRLLPRLYDVLRFCLDVWKRKLHPLPLQFFFWRSQWLEITPPLRTAF